MHWIVRVARASKIPGAQDLDDSPDFTVPEAWEMVVEQTGVSDEELAAAIADWFRLDVADLDAADPVAGKLLPGPLARKYNIYPLQVEDRSLVVATANPCDVDAEQQVGFASGRTPILQIAPPAEIESAIEATYAPDRAVADMLGRVESASEGAVIVEEVVEPDPDLSAIMEDEGDTGPIIRLTNMILEDAVQKGASDIHLQPLPTGGVIRLRIDGVLRSGITVPLAVLVQVISRVKVMSRLDISDRMRPQDGRARIRIDERRLDLRVSTVPVRGGEKAVIRILDPDKSGELDDAGFPTREVERLRQALKGRDGIVVVTGPTGSGKTTTMYAALREIATEDVNIMTVEDPVEYELPGLTQIQVDPKAGITFQTALKAILRQDPDVIFVGEIRDEPTAEMAAQASLTGHLVLATVHANDAVGAVRRLLDLGLDPGTISETLRASLAQRLVRTLCTDCVRPAEDPLDPEEARLSAQFDIRPPMTAVGCEACGDSGFRGRRPVVEILVPSTDLLQLVAEEASHVNLTRQARRDGMRTLLQGGLDLVKDGHTTLEEMVRVIGEETVSAALDTSEEEVESSASPSAVPSSDPPPSSQPAPSPSAAPGRPPPEERAPRASPAAGSPPPEATTSPEEADSTPEVLVVDDDPSIRLLVRAMLESHGWSVDEAPDGESAIRQLRQRQGLSLVVLDLALPDMDGLDVLRTAKKSIETAGIPVVVLTGRKAKETERQVLMEGAADFIRKPVDPAIFVARAKAAVRRHGT